MNFNIQYTLYGILSLRFAMPLHDTLYSHANTIIYNIKYEIKYGLQ